MKNAQVEILAKYLKKKIRNKEKANFHACPWVILPP